MAESIDEWLAEGNKIKTVEDCTLPQKATRPGRGRQTESHIHDWKPTSNGRYRCTRCFCHGYKLRVTGLYSEADAKLQGFIVEYMCKTAGCTGWATGKVGRYWRCPIHRPEE